MKDRVGREINYLRISITDLCNLRCVYCMPKDGVKKKKHCEILTLEEIEEVVKAASKLGVNKIRLTGGEPLVRRGVVELIEKIAKIPGIDDIAMTTNGVLLKNQAKELKKAGLNRVNISLDTFNEDKYRYITRGGKLQEAIEGIKAAKEAGLTPIKINTVLIKGFNDDEIEDFVNITLKNEIDIRFIELMPIGENGNWDKEHYISNKIVLEKFPDLIPLENKDKSAPAKLYKLPKAKGKVGLINPISSHFCCNCNRIRLTADGKIKPCLHSNDEIDIKTALRENKDILPILESAVMVKPKEHHLNEEGYVPINRGMSEIGG